LVPRRLAAAGIANIAAIPAAKSASTTTLRIALLLSVVSDIAETTLEGARKEKNAASNSLRSVPARRSRGRDWG
jgi:hypothetical protein